jgi:hypothetical protein
MWWFGDVVVWCFNALMLLCSGVLVIGCFDAWALWCFGVLVLWCLGASVRWTLAFLAWASSGIYALVLWFFVLHSHRLSRSPQRRGDENNLSGF